MAHFLSHALNPTVSAFTRVFDEKMSHPKKTQKYSLYGVQTLTHTKKAPKEPKEKMIFFMG
jgi:hypothetical protein